MAKVVFNSTDEFLEELEKDAKHVDRGIVRVTFMSRSDPHVPHGHHVTAVAGYTKWGQLVELRRYCGATWGLNDAKDQAVKDTAERVDRDIQVKATKLGLEVRAGLFEEAKANENP